MLVSLVFSKFAHTLKVEVHAMNKGPRKKKSHKKDKSKINSFLVDDDTRNAIMLSILAQLDSQSIDETGSLFEVAPDSNQPTLSYNVLVTTSAQTQEIEFHIYNPADPSNQLGEGAQGKVIVAQNMVTGNLVAVKVQSANGITFDEDLMRERRNLKIAKKLIGIASNFKREADGSEKQYEYTLMEYVSGQNLNNYLYEIDTSKDKESPEYFSSKKDIELRKKLSIVALLIKQVIDLHEKYQLAHRDIKTDNFVISDLSALVLSLIDLGSAIQYGSDVKENDKTNVGTFGYVAPEMLKPILVRPYYNFSCDYWALGVVIAEVLTAANYQAELRKMMLVAKAKDTLLELTLADVQKMMPDVFGSSSNNHPIWKELTSLVAILLQEQPEIRPNLTGLKDIRARLHKLYLEHPADANLGFARYKAMKRQNTLAALPRPSVREESSADLVKKSKEKKEKPKLVRSTTLKSLDPMMQSTSTLSMVAESSLVEIEKVDPALATEKLKKVRKKRSASAAPKKTSDIASSSNDLHESQLSTLSISDSSKTKKSTLKLERVDEAEVVISATKVKKRKKANIENNANTNSSNPASHQLESEKALSVLLEKLSLTEESSSSVTPPVIVPPRERALLSLFAQKTRHVRGLSGDATGFQIELASLQKMAESLSLAAPSDNPTVVEKMSDVKKSCEHILKHN